MVMNRFERKKRKEQVRRNLKRKTKVLRGKAKPTGKESVSRILMAKAKKQTRERLYARARILAVAEAPY